jgi:hypothetical protein
MTVIAYYVPHNQGIAAGIITGPRFDSGSDLVDLYEVDASIKSFNAVAEAEAWLDQEAGDELELQEVPGGLRSTINDTH